MDYWKSAIITENITNIVFIYNSKNNFSLWADIMDFFLEWDKQRNLNDENYESTHIIKS